jgi:hypothetical protein
MLSGRRFFVGRFELCFNLLICYKPIEIFYFFLSQFCSCLCFQAFVHFICYPVYCSSHSCIFLYKSALSVRMSPFSFLISIICIFFFLFLVSLVKCLSNSLNFSKNQLLVSFGSLYCFPLLYLLLISVVPFLLQLCV